MRGEARRANRPKDGFWGAGFQPAPLRPPAAAGPAGRMPAGCGGRRGGRAGVEGALGAGGGPQAPAKKPQARNNPRKSGERQRLCGPQARRLRRRNGLRPLARRLRRRAACGPNGCPLQGAAKDGREMLPNGKFGGETVPCGRTVWYNGAVIRCRMMGTSRRKAGTSGRRPGGAVRRRISYFERKSDSCGFIFITRKRSRFDPETLPR